MKHKLFILFIVLLSLNSCHWCPYIEEEYCKPHYYTDPPHNHHYHDGCGTHDHHHNNIGYCNFKYNKYMCITHKYHICHLCNEYVYVHAAICTLPTHEHVNNKLCSTLSMFHNCKRLDPDL